MENMEEESRKIKQFTDLNAWRVSHELGLMVYRDTKNFPRDELFGLTSQLRRCTISVTSNIAEGFSRQSYKEKVQFYSIALGSVTELQNQIIMAKDIGYLPEKNFEEIINQSIVAHKLINGLIKSSKTIIHNSAR